MNSPIVYNIYELWHRPARFVQIQMENSRVVDYFIERTTCIFGQMQIWLFFLKRSKNSQSFNWNKVRSDLKIFMIENIAVLKNDH